MRSQWATPRGKLRSSRLNNAGRGRYISFLTLTALHMPTAYKSAPFGIEVTRSRSQPSRQPMLDVKAIHKIAELELELLNIVRDYYGLDLPAVAPMHIAMKGIGSNVQRLKIRRPSPEQGDHCEGSGQSVRKLLSGFLAGPMESCRANITGQSDGQKCTFPAMSRSIATRSPHPSKELVRVFPAQRTSG